MATDVSGDLNLIQDEDVLRKMWSQADDYDRKKEIRLRMYKLREQRLKSYYTGDAITAITDTPPARKHAAVTHAESITDQGFMTMKDKEIRDSESPTRDLQQRQGNEKYWTTVQDTTTSSTGDDKNFTKTYSRTSDAKAAVDDNTQVQVSAKEQSLHSAATEVTDNATTKKEQLKLQAALSSASETVGPNGERISSKSEQEESNFTSHSTTESKSATGYSKSWQSSSSSSSSSRRVYSSSSTTQDNAIQNRRTSTDRKAITSVDDVLDNVSSTRKSYNVDETDFKNTEIRNSDYKTKRDFSTVEKSSTDEVKQVSTTKDSVRKSSDYDNSNLTYFRSNRDVPYTDNTDDADYEINVKITTNSSVKNQRNVPEKTSTKVTERVFDDNVRNESNKEDSYFTKEYSTRTSSKTVSQSNDVNTYETNKATSPTENVSRKGIIKHPSSLDLPKESADSQYMTTYQQSYQRINVENSPTHNAFASSLRASPDRSPVSSPTRSKSVTDRSSPERKLRSSPTRGSPERKFKTTPTRTPTSPERKFRTSPTTNSPDKDRRISVGSYTVETPRSPVRKVSDITPSRTSVTSTSTVTTSKQKRKFSSTKSKESSKKKASTPSVSPSASPTRQLTDAPDSAVESDNDSDASQATYSKSPVNFKQAFETTTTTTTAASTRSTSEQTRKSSLKKTSVSGESPRPIDKTPQSPERTSPSRTPVVEELIKPKTAYSECGLDCETKIDENIISKNVVTETSPAVNEPTVKPEKTFTAGETCEIEFTIRKNSASKGPEPITQSPIFNNVRDKSPEYSSEGSVGKEVKRMRSPVKESPSSNRSSPERSAFAPIKQFRTSPEIKKTTEPSYPAEILRKTSNTAPITDAPVGRKPSLKRSSPTKVSSPTRSVSSSASPASSPERRSPQNKIRKPSASAPVAEETEVVESTQETRITRKTSVPRSNSKQSLTKKQPELKTPVKDRVTQGTRIPSSTDLRSSSVTRKTNRASETITITKKAPSKPTEVTRTPQRGPSNSNLKTVKTTLTTTVNASPRYSSPVRKPGTPTQIARLKPSPVRGTGPSNTTTNRVTSRSEVTVTVSPSRKPAPKKETPSMKPRSHEAPKRPESPLRKPTTFSKDAKTSSLRALQLICSQEINKTENVDNFEYEVDIDENNLEDELPPDDFASDVTDRENVRTTTRSVVTKTVTTKVTPAKKPSVQALKSDNKYNRSSNEKLISRLATPKKQPTKPEIVTPKTSRVPTKISPGKTPVAKKAPLTKKGSTGSTTGSKKTITKKSSKDSIKRVDDDSSSCSEDELHDVSITVDSSERDQKYVEELEEIRRRDESEHGSKVFATSNKDSSLLSVIVQLPSSSRESSPDYASRSQYSAAVSDDGSEKPVRYADRVSEPEDSDVNMKVKSADFLRAEGRIYEQVTDLDEESESETTKVDVSVADRVSKFLQSTKTSNTTTTSTTEVQSKKDKSVLKAAALFDKIVEDQYVPVGPSNKVIDIYSKQFPGHEAVTVEDRSDQYQEILESVLDIDGRRRSSVNVDETDDIAPTRTFDRRQSSVASINKEDYKASIKAFEKRRSSVNVNDVAAATKLSEKRRSSVKPEDVTPVSKTYESRKSSVKPEDVAPVSKTYDSRRSSANVENVVSSTSVYDRRRSSNTEDVILESKTLERRKSSIPAETKSDDVVTEEIINVEVKENKKAPFERKESAFAADYKSRKDFFEKKATTPINSVPSSPRAAPKFGTNLKTTTNQTVETREVTSFTRRDSETRKSPEKDLSTPRKPSLKDSPVENQRLPSSRKSPEKEVPSKVASPKEDAPSPRKDSLPQKDSFTTRRDSFSPKEPASPQKGPLSRKPSEKEVTPTVTDTTPTKAPADKPHESTLFKPTLSSSRRSSTPRKSPERQAPIERQPSSNELPQNVRKAPEKPTVRGAKSIMDRLSIFERGATEKTSPVKKTDFRGFGRTTKTESSSTFIQNERKVAEVEKKPDEPEPSSFERKTSRTEIVLKPATPADQKPQTRRDSSARKSPERRPSASQPSPVEQQPRGRPESPKKSPSVSEFERKSSFTSSTAQKTVQAETSNKFSTTLRRTPSQSGPTPSTPSTAATPKRNSIVKESGTEIEEIFDVQLLEQMMESSKNYDDRRRIRAQIRIAKRKPDTTSKSSSTYETTTVTTTKTTKPTSRSSITEKVEFVTATPKESPKNEAKSQFTSEYKTEFTSKSSTTTSGTRPVESEPSRPKEAAPTVESKKEIVLERRPSGTDRSLQKTDSFHRRGSKTADGVYEFTVTTKQSSQKSSSFATSKTEEVTGTDSITSSYGVGPTDENGLPLFGLKALRRSNTSKTLLLTDEVSAELNGTSEPDSGFRDTGGRPLFGGLKALKKSAPAEDMPEQPASPQLRDLVQRHEKHVRESTTIDNSPRQKPTRKLRDSFVLQPQDEEELVRSIANAGSEQKHSTEEATSSQKTVSLRSIMKKPDNFDSGAEVHMETRRSVISSHGTVNADGTVSVTRNVVQGKISSKNGEEPSGLITRTQYNYEAPSIHEEGRSETTTQTTTLGNRRLSTGPQITEAIEDSEESRRSSSKRYVSSRSSSGTKITEILENGTDSRRSSTHEEVDGKLNGILKKSGSGKFNVASSTVVTTSTSETVTNGDSSRKSSVDAERRKPSLVRGDSIKALQHKFQQATVSSSLKQNSGASVRNRSSSNSLDSSTRTTTKTSQPVESSQNETSVKTSSYSVKSKTESTSSGPTSFLDNKSKVTGVQDILERMRNADLASDVTESTEDQEARSLLNKFLGASVILQGMEAGMKSINGRSPQSLTTNSATLVNRVEKQRMASEAKTQNLDELDLETIWDEQHLKNLLEACTDYEGRRKIRARLRTVMAEHKACGDVTALVSNSVGADASMTQDCSESSSVSTKTEGNTTTRTEVHTHTSTSRATLTKSGSLASSPFAKFRQLERQHSAPSSGTARAPIYKITDPKLMNSAATIKERLLSWVKAQTKEYKNIQIENFSTSWSNGLAFCALIHHFLPNAFDYNKLTPEERRYNFELAFRVAEEEAGIAPLLDVEDMVIMRRPDWKCVFTYVQSIYRCFHKSNRAVLVFNF